MEGYSFSINSMVMVVVFVSMLVVGSWSESLELQDVPQHPSIYHLTMLKRSIDSIKRSWVSKEPRSHVFKRSTKSQGDDLLLKSFATYCTNFQADPTIARHNQRLANRLPLSQRDISGFTRFKSDSSGSSGTRPSVFPIKVWGGKENDDKIWIIFEIAHSRSSVIARRDRFSYQKVILETPDDASCRIIVSKARFAVDIPKPDCTPKSGEVIDRFEMTSMDNHRYQVETQIDLCLLYHTLRRRSKTFISELVVIPGLRLVPDPGDFVLIDNGQKTTFNLEIDYKVSYNLSLTLILWDWAAGKTLYYSAWILHGPRIVVKETNLDSKDIFTLDLINTGRLLKITLEKLSENQSGKIRFSYSHKNPIYYGKIATQVKLEQTIDLRQATQPKVFPDDMVFLTPHQRFSCNENGNKNQEDVEEFLKNCTLRCHAFGQDIASLYITKLGIMKSPARATSYVEEGEAVAILDVGPSSADVEGDYRCVAVDKRGQTTTQNMKLYTSLITEMVEFQVKGHDLKVVQLRCSVKGASDLNISFVVSNRGRNETLLDKYEQNMTRDGDVTTVTMIVPWKDLKFPKDILTCSAQGERGDVMDSENIAMYEGNRYAIYPIVIKDKKQFKVKRNSNGTISFTCDASGAEPLEMTMYLKQEYLEHRIKLDPSVQVTTTTERLGDVTSMTYTIPDDVIGRRNLAMRCIAANKFGVDRWAFRLRLYLGDRG